MYLFSNFIILLVLLYAIPTVPYSSQYLFPPNDEYDPSLINPETLYGSPYGGYSRASSSRLAKLPLRFISGTDELKKENEGSDNIKSTSPSSSPHSSSSVPASHFAVRDHIGRQYACKVYKKGELTNESQKDSMFNLAAISPPSSSSNDKSDNAILDTQREKHISKIISSLKGICSHHHVGNWTYEWCFRKSFHQYRLSKKYPIQNQTSPASKTFRYDISEYHNLGQHHDEKIIFTPDEHPTTTTTFRIHEDFQNGNHCDDINANRSVSVSIKCCDKRQWFDLLDYDRDPTTWHRPMLAILTNVTEVQMCRYEAEVCTRLFCDDENYINNIDDGGGGGGSGHRKSSSVQDIIKKELRGICLTKNEGWWTYSLCHGRTIFQYHSHISPDERKDDDKNNRRQQQLYTKIQSEHIIGRYNVTSIPFGEEHLHMTNGSVPSFGITYTKGDECVYSPELSVTAKVLDLLRKLKNTAKRWKPNDTIKLSIEMPPPNTIFYRNTTVRFTCGDMAELVAVAEDEACQFFMDVTLPGLCRHELFWEVGDDGGVTSKRGEEEEEERVVKCLPLDV